MNKFFTLFLLFFSFHLFSQQEANFWYFGENAGIDFSTNPPTSLTDGQLNTTEGCSSFSSPSGELLFYSDGIEVFNKNHELMTYSNGSLANNLRGNPSSTQSGMIIPKPGSTTIYYLFTVGTDFVGNANDPNPGFNYYTIDMSKNNNLGEIIDGPVNLAIDPSSGSDLSASWSEKVAAVKGKECNVFWVVSFAQNNFFSYKITDAGVDLNNVVVSQASFNTSDKRGYLKVSPDGSKLAFADYNAGGGGDITGRLFLMNFDNETGTVDAASTQTLINSFTGDSPYGIAFSQQSNKLYASTFNNRFSVYQFDLESTNIISTRAQIISKPGFRGALQLAPNGKIYASIPDSSFLDAIENPNEDAENIIYTENAINLNGRRTTQGLPPFISSLLLPIQITDVNTNNTINNQDVQFCIGDNKTIISEEVTGNNITYSWTFDDGSGFVEISNSKDLVLTNLQFSDSGDYALKIQLTDECDNLIQYNGSFKIDVFEAAAATKPTDIFFCDTDRDGFNQFNLQDLKNDEILNGLDPNIFEVMYFTDIADANMGNNVLSTPYTNPSEFSSQTIYARVQNKNAPNACFAITDFILEINDLPIPVQPLPYRICDDNESGSDTDGVINTFVLSNKDDEIYGNLNKSQYNISYYTTQLGAENNDISTIIDKNSNYTVINSQIVFIRTENKDNTDCYDANATLELIVDPLPVLKTSPILEQCIGEGNTNPTVNLTLAEFSISETPNAIFTYFEDATAINQISNPTSYPVQVNTTQSIFVRVTTVNGCTRDIVEVKINIGQTPDNPFNTKQPPVCDDFLDAQGNDTDANSDTDNITNFSLDKDAIINSINPPMNTEVFFYENESDRNNSLNEIDITNFRNDITKNDVTNIPNGIQFPIYYKILSTINNDCQGLGQFYLQINAVPSASQVPDLELCDDGIDGDNANGIVQNFDLDSQTLAILNGQNPDDFTVTYHDSAANANTGTLPLTSPYANTTRDLQTIFVRVTNNSTGCFTDHTSFNLIVNPVPIANFVKDLEVCDDNADGSARNGFSQSIDLDSQTSGILGSQDSGINTVTYHRSFAEAQNGSNPLVSPYSNQTPNRETIYIRIENTDTGCVNSISNFDVIVNPEPTFVVPTNLAYCDDALDGDDSNGIIQNIDLDSKIPEILGTSQNPNDFTVTFHKLQADASSGDNAIASPYENTNPSERFFVRIQNKQTLCINDDASFEVIVNPLPDFEVTTPQTLCLNDLPLNIAVENPRDVYAYQWIAPNGNPINTTSVEYIDITVPGKYTVTATTTNGTLCERTETIEIKESNIATLAQSFITIIDESNNIGSQDLISIFIDTINNDLGPGDYQFAIFNQDDNERIPMIGFQDEPLFENLTGGIYTIIVNDKNGCEPDTTLEVSVIQFPKFFTPNGDGNHDTWIVKGVNKTFYPNSSINIFNRYGKLVAQVPIDSQGWNGIYQGNLLPADDYWFNITLIPPENSNKPIINKKGNFSLLRD
ncbi:T9SS type B sorting domain-containing protein [Polaribacter sp. R77954]|uniref:T9SS type B sorting domain-containing protein n=1 Tax=Polaribacter sp. R77954 TaxID=3093870 RepID=UPI0037CAF887